MSETLTELEIETMTTNYVKFTERNEWEGETWNFWIPTDGNEAALKALADALGGDGENETYELDLEPVPEHDVDVLVHHSDGDYMATHNKLVGFLHLPDDLEKALADDGDAAFYKGGIQDLMNMTPAK